LSPDRPRTRHSNYRHRSRANVCGLRSYDDGARAYDDVRGDVDCVSDVRPLKELELCAFLIVVAHNYQPM